MKIKKMFFVSALILVFASFAAASLLDSIAVISDFRGAVQIKKDNKWHYAARNMPVYEETEIVTRTDSYIEITFDDATIVRIDENTNITLNALERDEKHSKTVFNLVKGKFLAIVDRLRNPQSSFEVHTNMAIAAVKGTEFAVIADENETLLGVNKGTVMYSAREAGSKAVMVNRNRQSLMRRGMKGPSEPSGLDRKKLGLDSLFGKMREEIMTVRELKKQGGDNLRRWREQKNEEEGAGRKRGEFLKKRLLKHKLRKNMQNTIRHSLQDLKQIREEMKADLFIGKTMVDVRGNRVRMEEYIFRPAPDRVDLLTLNLREGRIDYLNVKNTFNAPLPEIIPKNAFNTYWLTEPKYYRLTEDIFMSNTLDTVRSIKNFGHIINTTDDQLFFEIGAEADVTYEIAAYPKHIANNNSWIIEPVEKKLIVNNQLKEHTVQAVRKDSWSLTTLGGVLPDNADYVIDWIKMPGDKTFVSLEEIDSASMAINGAPVGQTTGEYDYAQIYGKLLDGVYKPFEIYGHSPNDGQLTWMERRIYNDGDWLQFNFFLINDYGKLLSIVPNTTAEDYFEILFDANVEMIASSNLFQGRDIDIVSKFLWWTTIAPKNNTRN